MTDARDTDSENEKSFAGYPGSYPNARWDEWMSTRQTYLAIEEMVGEHRCDGLVPMYPHPTTPTFHTLMNNGQGWYDPANYFVPNQPQKQCSNTLDLIPTEAGPWSKWDSATQLFTLRDLRRSARSAGWFHYERINNWYCPEHALKAKTIACIDDSIMRQADVVRHNAIPRLYDFGGDAFDPSDRLPRARCDVNPIFGPGALPKPWEMPVMNFPNNPTLIPEPSEDKGPSPIARVVKKIEEFTNGFFETFAKVDHDDGEPGLMMMPDDTPDDTDTPEENTTMSTSPFTTNGGELESMFPATPEAYAIAEEVRIGHSAKGDAEVFLTRSYSGGRIVRFRPNNPNVRLRDIVAPMFTRTGEHLHGKEAWRVASAKDPSVTGMFLVDKGKTLTVDATKELPPERISENPDHHTTREEIRTLFPQFGERDKDASGEFREVRIGHSKNGKEWVFLTRDMNEQPVVKVYGAHRLTPKVISAPVFGFTGKYVDGKELWRVKDAILPANFALFCVDKSGLTVPVEDQGQPEVKKEDPRKDTTRVKQVLAELGIIDVPTALNDLANLRDEISEIHHFAEQMQQQFAQRQIVGVDPANIEALQKVSGKMWVLPPDPHTEEDLRTEETRLSDEIEKLARVIMNEIDGEPSAGELDAIARATRIIRGQKANVDALTERVEEFKRELRLRVEEIHDAENKHRAAEKERAAVRRAETSMRSYHLNENVALRRANERLSNENRSLREENARLKRDRVLRRGW